MDPLLTVIDRMEAATQPELLYLAKVADNIESYNEALEFVEKAAIIGG